MIVFPSFFPEDDDFAFYERLKQKIMLIGQQIIEDEIDAHVDRLLVEINNFFIDLNKPKDFSPKNGRNAIKALEYNYEYLCAMLESNGMANPKKLSLFEFYSRLEYLKKTTPHRNDK